VTCYISFVVRAVSGGLAKNFPLTLIDLAGTVALLLWGVRMVQTGVQRAFGPKLRVILARSAA
jgi:Na+/phosphate symporter